MGGYTPLILTVRMTILIMKYRFGTENDIDLLAQLNHRLIRDEGHRNTMSVQQLQGRMNAWMKDEYKAVIFEVGRDVVAYALYREGAEEIHLRQLFVMEEHRRQGIGREAVDILRTQLWPSGRRLSVEVLTGNRQAIGFWRSVGYTDYCLTLEIMPKDIGEQDAPVDADKLRH